MATDEQTILKQMNDKLKELETCDGFWIAITRRDGKTLHHWQGRIKMSNDDVYQSLKETEKLIGIKGERKGIITPQRRFH